MTNRTWKNHGLAGIQTKYYGPTNARGSRVSVRRSDHRKGDPIRYYPYDPALSQYDNHVNAAEQYLSAEFPGWDGLFTPAAIASGYVFARGV